jgi:hypothetical protein
MKRYKIMKNEENKMRFTTLITPTILTKIKLISYFTNSTISNLVEDSLINFLNIFETQNNIHINDLMKMKDKFSIDNPLDQEVVEIEEDLRKTK